MHLPDRVLRQYGYMQTISPPPPVQDMVAFETVNARWIHFADNVVTALIPVVGPHACIEDHIACYSRVSHPYLIRGDEEGDRRSRSRSHSLSHSHSHDDDQPATSSQQQSQPASVFHYIHILIFDFILLCT